MSSSSCSHGHAASGARSRQRRSDSPARRAPGTRARRARLGPVPVCQLEEATHPRPRVAVAPKRSTTCAPRDPPSPARSGPYRELAPLDRRNEGRQYDEEAGRLGDTDSHLLHAEGLQAQEPPHGLLDDPGHFAAFRATVIFQGGVGRRGEVDRTPSSLASLPRHQSVSRCSAKRRRRRRTARDHGCRRMDVLRRLRAPIDVYGRFTRSVYRRLLTARNVPGCYELRGHSSSERWRASWRGG